MREKLQWIVVSTLSIVMLSVVAVMLVGLFDDKVDNDKIFAIIGPAFQMIVGCFVGYLGGRLDNESNKESKKNGEANSNG